MFTFVKFGYSIGIFLSSAYLICRSMDIISQSVSEGPLDFEIATVNCTLISILYKTSESYGYDFFSFCNIHL